MPVKFWLLENFISPEFKNSIQRLADSVGFEVAFVTYRWPMWLRKQTVKQRIIWGYKSEYSPVENGVPRMSLMVRFFPFLRSVFGSPLPRCALPARRA